MPPGSRPAAIPLVPAHKFGPWSHRKSCGATRDPLVHTSTHAPSFEPRRPDRRSRLNFSTLSLTPNPHSSALAPCPTPRDFVHGRFPDAGLSSAWMVLCSPTSENLHNTRLRTSSNHLPELSRPQSRAAYSRVRSGCGGRTWSISLHAEDLMLRTPSMVMTARSSS